MNTTGLEQLTARFNMNSTGLLFVVCEEIANGKGTANADKLKGIAEQQKMDFEGKYFDTISLPDHRSIILLSNHRHALDDTNRKFFQVEVSNMYSRKSRSLDPAVDAEAAAYFTALGAAIMDPESVSDILCTHACAPRTCIC